MRILITGGCGFLGSHIIEHFLKNTDADLVVLDKLTYASNGFDRLRDIADNNPDLEIRRRVKLLGCDLAQDIPLGVMREIGNIDFAIHAAAESHVDNSISNPLPFLTSNIIGTHHLLMLAQARDVRRVFMVSTDEVYGPAPMDKSVDFTEQSPFRPANPYAASKAGAEAVAFAYANTYKIPVTIVNTMNLIGERQHPEKFVPLVIRKVLAGEIVTIHSDPTRTQSGSRFYLHCRTFAHALHFLIRCSDKPSFMPQKVHVCGEVEITNLALAKTIAEFVGRNLSYEMVDFHSSRPGHDLRYAMDDTLIRKMGWQRPMNIHESLEKTVAWYLSNRSWLDTGK